MKKNTIKIFAPATVSNVAVGFDHLGFAINGPGDEVFIGDGDEPGLVISEIKGAQGRLPLEVEKNTAGIAAMRLLEYLGEQDRPLEMKIFKKMPFGSGLGSSAASAVAGAFAVSTYLNTKIEKVDLLPFAMQGEAIASGGGVADNVASSMLGGMVLIRDNKSLDLKKIHIPKGIYAMVIHPQIKILTLESRNKLDKKVDLDLAVKQAANFASFVSAMYTSDIDLLHRCLTDLIIEPQRAASIPHFYEMKTIAMEEGAMGFSISGSGPSLFCLTQNRLIAEKIGERLSKLLLANKIKNQYWVSEINHEGVIKC
jgi:homoserine kinase